MSYTVRRERDPIAGITNVAYVTIEDFEFRFVGEGGDWWLSQIPEQGFPVALLKRALDILDNIVVDIGREERLKSSLFDEDDPDGLEMVYGT